MPRSAAPEALDSMEELATQGGKMKTTLRSIFRLHENLPNLSSQALRDFFFFCSDIEKGLKGYNLSYDSR